MIGGLLISLQRSSNRFVITLFFLLVNAVLTALQIKFQYVSRLSKIDTLNTIYYLCETAT